MLWELLVNPPSYIKPGKAVKWLHYPLGSALKEMSHSPFYPGEPWFQSRASSRHTQGCLWRSAQANPPVHRYSRELHNGVMPRTQLGATIITLLNLFSVPLRALGGQMIPLLFLFLSNLILLQGPTLCLTLYEIDYMDFIQRSQTHTMVLCPREENLIMQCWKHWIPSFHGTCTGLPSI